MNRILAALIALACLCAPTWAATLLPNGQQTFTDANGKPLAGGTVQFYIPNTTTAKSTWKDAAQTVLNSNPVTLDSAGRATIYGSGAYRQVVKDRFGNLVWDQLTADTSSSQIAWGGTSAGSANAQTVTAPNFTSTDGQIVGFLAGFSNTGQLTISANGSGPIPVLRDGQSGPVNLTGSEVIAGSAILLIYDSGRGAFHLVGGSATAAGFGAAQNLVAAGVTDLGLISTHNVVVTGISTITSFGNSASVASPLYVVRFAGKATIVNSGAIAVPGNANLAVYPGDVITAAYQGSGVWQIVAYQPQEAGIAPPGLLFSFAGPNCPAGSLPADGSAISRTAFERLFQSIGGTWGVGDGSTTFNLPDARGQFLRGFDNGRGLDPGRALASAQADAIGPHSHSFQVETGLSGAGAAFQYPKVDGATPFPVGGQTPAAGNETRPKNIAVLYCIKT